MRNSNQRNRERLSTQQSVKSGLESGRLRIIFGDLNGDISGIAEGCDAIVHFAAKTFVDRSIKDPYPFVETNVVGTYKLLEEARRDKIKRFINVSTDEVYGAILSGAYTEDARINPTNPYSATKAGADALTISYTHTFGLWTAITRTENNYGPYQGPEKVFPTFVRHLLRGDKLPVYGDGKHRRQWLWVTDHVKAILLLLTADVAPAQIFHVAGSQELENLELAKRIIHSFAAMHVMAGDPIVADPSEWKQHIRFVEDHDIRPGHDRRYALICDKLKALGWKPEVDLEKGIPMAVDWYTQHPSWLE